MAEAREALAGVQDYTCTFVKQERIGDKLMPEQTADMAVRQKPFSVHIRFTAPPAVAGQEVCYVAGKNDGKMRARGNGLKSALGFVTLAVDDPRALAQSRHTIAEAGLANLIEQAAKAHAAARRAGLQPQATPDEVAGRACTRVELALPNGPEQYAHRLCIWFDHDTRLPVRFEAFAEPAGGHAGDGLLERYTYLGLRLNPGLSEAVFAR